MKRNYILLGLSALLVGCSLGDDVQEASADYAKITKVGMTIEPYQFGDDASTRTTYTFSETSGLSFSWAAGDTLGVFPVSPSGCQVYQVLKEKGDDTTGGLYYSFDGDAWLLKSGNSYASYHPFANNMRLNEDYKSVPINMVGQKQNGNASTAHLGKYHIMYAPPVFVAEESSEVNLEFHNVNSLIKVDVTFPVAATWKKLVFESDNPVFITSALMDATNGELTPTKYSNSIELELENVTSTANQTLTFFISLLPTTTDEVTLSAVTSDYTTYTALLPTKTTVASKIYRWSATLGAGDEYDGKDFVDLGLGILWGRNNVNISGSADGEYYAWGELNTKDTYLWSNYKYGTSSTSLTYCTPADGYTDLYVQDDDVAYRNINDVTETGSWRIPTKDELEELISGCYWKWVVKDGVGGYKVSNKTNPARYIFLPVTGLHKYGIVDATFGYYWSRDVSTESENWSQAYCLKFDRYGGVQLSAVDRCTGVMIRPVLER